ncbi:MAG: regulator [Mycetocola sp.]|nr:regulator [Mycetocola sp.]
MPRIALALPLDMEDRILPHLVRHGYDVVTRCDSANELSSQLAAASADVALVASIPRYLTGRLIDEADAAGVRVVALAATADAHRHAASLHLREVIEAEADWERIEAVLNGTPLLAKQHTSGPPPGQVIAVWGPAGAPGRTTLAINIAAEIAAAGFTVALADVDTYSGSVAPALDLLDEAPGFAAACRLAATDSLDSHQLERIGQRYSSARGSFWVLTGIGRSSRWPELSADRVVGALRECRSWVDYTVVDTGFSLEHDEEISTDLFAPRRNAATIAALREADRVIAVGSADPVGLSRFLRAHVDLIETLATDRVIAVMNKIRAGAIGLNPGGQVHQSLERFGGITSPVLIPLDQGALDSCVLSGKTLMDASIRSPVRAAISAMVVQRILPVAKHKGRRRNLFRPPAR